MQKSAEEDGARAAAEEGSGARIPCVLAAGAMSAAGERPPLHPDCRRPIKISYGRSLLNTRLPSFIAELFLLSGNQRERPSLAGWTGPSANRRDGTVAYCTRRWCRVIRSLTSARVPEERVRARWSSELSPAGEESTALSYGTPCTSFAARVTATGAISGSGYKILSDLASFGCLEVSAAVLRNARELYGI